MKDSDKGWLLFSVLIVLLVAMAALVFGTDLFSPGHLP
jgi:hypothetical protein